MTGAYLFVSLILWLFGGFKVLVDLLNNHISDPLTVIQVFWLGFIVCVALDLFIDMMKLLF